MALWTLVGLLTVVAVATVLWPLRRRVDSAPSGSAGDVAVYRDQLEEIGRDQASGLIDGSEAEAARIEVSRRLLAAADRMQARGAPVRDGEGLRRRRFAATAALIVLPVGAIALYLAIGSPGLEDEPIAARIAAAHGDRSDATLFARVEAHLEQHPDDGRGWEVIAPIYMELGRYDDAVKARGNALRLLDATAEREAYYGEALTAAANGVVTAQAKAAFDRAIDRDPRDPTARFYQGLAAEQDGSREDAARIWRALLADAPDGAEWAPFVRQALARLNSPAGTEVPASAGKRAEQGVEPPGQDQMIRGMVERLAARLQQDGSDVDGWVRLVRSYKVLGDTERINGAIADARRALANDPAALKRLDDGVKSLDAEPSTAATMPASGAPDAKPVADPAAGRDPVIRGMVERLAARLHQDGSDVEGWIMLVRSCLVLGDRNRASAAVVEARQALGNQPDKLHRLEEGVKSLGIEG
jgi:cytochrome c-type biogenesis protein CcmH